MNRRITLLNIFDRLHDALGPSRWWPGEHPFEIAVGAILTQNTNWGNVEKAMANLRREGRLTPAAMAALPDAALAELIRPAGFFRLKAGRLRHFLDFLRRENDGDHPADTDMAFLAERDLPELRERLLAVKGIGPETADSILLYALGLPTFVVDAYTARIFSRHLLTPEEAGYEELKEFFEDVLPREARLFNEFHALIVRAGKQWCLKTRPRCETCPLGPLLEC